jgi:hypothetical protein
MKPVLAYSLAHRNGPASPIAGPFCFWVARGGGRSRRDGRRSVINSLSSPGKLTRVAWPSGGTAMRSAFAVLAACFVLGGCAPGDKAYHEANLRPQPHRHLYHRHSPKPLKTSSARTSKPLPAVKTNDGVITSQQGQLVTPSGSSSSSPGGSQSPTPSGSSSPSASPSPSKSSSPSASPTASGSSSPSASPSASANPPATTSYYIVLDPVDSCAVIDTKPSVSFNTVGDKSGYTSLAAANKALRATKAKCKRSVE